MPRSPSGAFFYGGKMKFDLNKEMLTWKDVVNNNIKWATALLIRIIVVLISVVVLMMGLKWTGTIKELINITSDDVEIEHEKTVYTSKPTIPTHKSDIKDIENVQNMIKNRVKTSKKAINDAQL